MKPISIRYVEDEPTSIFWKLEDFCRKLVNTDLKIRTDTQTAAAFLTYVKNNVKSSRIRYLKSKLRFQLVEPREVLDFGEKKALRVVLLPHTNLNGEDVFVFCEYGHGHLDYVNFFQR